MTNKTGTENTTLVAIFGRNYRIAGSDRERIQRVAACLNEKIREITDRSGGLDRSRTLVLAALELTAELFQAQRDNEQLLRKAHESIDRLSQLIDQRGDLMSITSTWIDEHTRPAS